jgi:hypothetical protein
MITQETLNKIELLISSQKAAVYKNRDAANWFDIYKAELTQAKEIFIYLHFLEIFLRNKIAAEFSLDLGDWLFSEQLDLKEKE